MRVKFKISGVYNKFNEEIILELDIDPNQTISEIKKIVENELNKLNT